MTKRPRKVESRHGRGVVHVGSYRRGHSYLSRSGHVTACGSFLTNALLGTPDGPITCQGCLDALGLNQQTQENE